jgi:ABC-2 type transport system ATP-binding protein
MGTDDAVIRVTGLTKSYGTRQVLTDVSFEVGPGRIVGLLGRNGAGKTTLMKTLVGIATPDTGTVEVLGGSPQANTAHLVGVAMDAVGFFPATTVRSELAIWARSLGVTQDRVDDLIDLVGLKGHERQKCKALSTGQRQRLRIATAMLSPTVELLVLDEPANGLDPDGVRWMRRLLRAEADAGKTVLVSSHLLNEMEHTIDDVLLLEGGQIAHSSPLAELTNGGALSLEEQFFKITDR